MLYLMLADKHIMPPNLIMVIDDDADLRDLYVESLKSKGLRVKGSSDPKIALDEISDEPQKYSLVISDVMMAAMNGSILANKVKEINNDIKVILVSGFDYSGMDLSHCHYDRFIQIPITISEFMSTVNKVLQVLPQPEFPNVTTSSNN